MTVAGGRHAARALAGGFLPRACRSAARAAAGSRVGLPPWLAPPPRQGMRATPAAIRRRTHAAVPVRRTWSAAEVHPSAMPRAREGMSVTLVIGGRSAPHQLRQAFWLDWFASTTTAVQGAAARVGGCRRTVAGRLVCKCSRSHGTRAGRSGGGTVAGSGGEALAPRWLPVAAAAAAAVAVPTPPLPTPMGHPPALITALSRSSAGAPLSCRC